MIEPMSSIMCMYKGITIIIFVCVGKLQREALSGTTDNSELQRKAMIENE